MTKLLTIRPLITAMKPLLGRIPGDEAERLRERDRNVSWRKWYRTERWRKLRQVILLRDAYVCQRTGILCIGRYPASNSPVIDHIEPHRGEERLFWDENNLQTVSKAYHDSEKQAAERNAINGRWY